MNNSQAHALASRFIRLAPEKRRVFLDALNKEGVDFAAFPIVSSAGEPARCQLSYAQQRMWFLWLLDPDSAAYNLTTATELNGPLNIEALTHALNSVITRHEILRTLFPTDDQGQPYQFIRESAPIEIGVEGLMSLPSSKQDEEVRIRVERESLIPFDLVRGPLLRVKLFELDEQRHVLLITLHHIVADGWSINVLIDELMRFYEAYTTNTDADIIPLTIQYADYGLWQRSWLESGELQRQLDYWCKQLEGDQPVLQLPADHARTSERSFVGARYEWEIDSHLADGLRVLAQKHNASLFMVLLAAFKVLLYRYTGESDIRIGVPVANRHRSETEGLIGCFINTQVIRTAIDYQSTFSGLLDKVRDTVLDAQSHQELPFEQLVDALNPERSLSHNPLFQVMFNHQALLTEVDKLSTASGLQVRQVDWDKQTTQFDLKLDTWEKGEKLYAAFTYVPEIYEHSTVKGVAADWLSLLAVMVDAPSSCVGDVPLLNEADSELILRKWNNTAVDFTDNSCIHHLFEDQVALRFDAVAVVGEGEEGDQVLTYGELNRQANQLAHHLRALGVTVDTPVGIAMERTPQVVVALLAVLKAGGAYVPLEPEYPEDRLRYMMKDSGIHLLLTQQSLRGRMPMMDNITILSLDTESDASVWREADDNNLPLVGTPDNLAYIIYTSGTTGRPKGVAVTHGSLCNYTRGIERRAQFPASGNFAMVSTYAADLGHTMLYGALCGGRTLHLMAQNAALDAEQFAAYMEHHNINALKIVPSHLLGLLQAHNNAASIPAQCLVLGGEACPLTLVRRVRALRPDCRIINHYGPTETTVGVMTHNVGDLDAENNIPIGRPIANSCAYIVDEALNAVPYNAVGELYIGGAGLARGYHGSPAATAERFVPSPFSLGRGERLYRSGDRVLRKRSGEVEYLGRIDNQIKIRGYRIEFDEIESCLKQSSQLRDAAVSIARDDRGNPSLTAYLVPVDNADKPEGDAFFRTEIKTWLEGMLPGYMVPSQYVLLDRMPLTPNGKLDRKALPVVDASILQRTYQPPITSLQRQVAAVWQEVLGVDRVGLGDNFFELGGHSLLITQVVTRLRHALDIEFPLRTLFEAESLEVFCQAVVSKLASPQGNKQEQAIKPVSRDQLIPMSFAQTRQWLLWQMEPNSAAYNINLAFRIFGDLDIRALEQSFEYLMTRQEVWRTHFAESEEGPCQIIAEAQPFDFTPECLPENADLKELLREFGRQPFDLTTGPLLRAKLLRLGDREHLLAVTQHHIISDGWSMQVLINELVEVYRAFRRKEQPNLPLLPIQYADYAVWQRRNFDEAEKVRQLTYWQQRLGNEHPILELPTDFPRPAQPSFSGADYAFTLPDELVQKIHRLTRDLGVTPFMWFMASFHILLHRYSGQDQVRVGAPVANRTRLETENLVGFFVNTQVHRADISGNMSVAELLRQTKQSTLEAQDHQDLPFEQLVAALQPERSLSYSPLFQVLFNYQTGHGVSPESFAARLGDLSVEEVNWDEGAAQFDLTLEIAERGTGTVARFNYAKDLFKPQTVERLARHWWRLLDSMTNEPGRRLSELPMFSEGEIKSILNEWNGSTVDYGQGACIHELFEMQAVATPDARALILPACEAEKFESRKEQTLTYAELNTRANKLAHMLRSMGVGPDVLVGMAVERSLEMIIGLLGILKAGGAYVPLDLTYPEDRLRYMIDDSRIAVLLTLSRHRDTLPVPESIRVLCLDGDGDEAAAACWHNISCENPPLLTHPSNLAYVIYTSGSTGKPKGTLLAHRNVNRLMQGTEQWFHFDNKDVWTLFHSYAFDFSVWEIFGALLYGGQLVIVPHEVARLTENFYGLLRDYGVTVLNQTPSAFRQLMEIACDRSEREGETLVALRYVIFGGEALAVESLRRWFDCFGDQAPQLINMYGITETTVHVTYRPIAVADQQGSPIGKPVRDLCWYVLDGEGLPVAPGCNGELYIAGAGLARGYYGRSGLTAERFVPDPYDEKGGGRLYRTGDLACYQTNGNIEYVGRIDYQVKIRGFRIELGEIESQLSALSAVKDVVVIVEEGVGGRQLVAYVVPYDGALVPEGREVSVHAQNCFRKEVRGRLQAVLPEYMVPNLYVLLGEMPLTHHGKLDRKALPIMDGGFFVQEYQAPQSVLERQLASIWQEVLGVERVSLNDNFFALGGHSLLATQVISRIRQVLALDLPLRALFEAGDLRALAERLASEASVSVAPIEPISRDLPLPLSYAQQRQWVLWQLAPESVAYQISAAIRLKGVLNREALQKSFDALVSRHEVLRTHFSEQDGELCQVIAPAQSLEIALEELDSADEKTEDDALRRVLESHVSQPFDLNQGPLLRAHLIRLSGEDHVLSLVQHHIVSDAWSMRLMVEELVSAYRAYSQGQEPDFPALPVQYADYAAWQRQIMEAGEGERQLAYWRAKLGEEHPVLDLPTDYTRPQLPSHRGATYYRVLSKALSTSVEAEAKKTGLTPFMFLLASFQVLLYRYSGQSDIRVGVPIANRTRLETERLIGFFVNTQVLKAEFDLSLSVGDLLQQVKRTALEAQAHQDLPFEQLVEVLQPERSLTTTPLFQVMFNYQEGRDESMGQQLEQLADLTVERIAWQQETAQFDLALNVVVGQKGLSASFNYATDLFERETIEGLARHWQRLLEAMVADPDQRIADLPMLSEEDIHRILREWNDTSVDYGEGIFTHCLFEAQVEKTPEAIALIFPAQNDQAEQQLTYAELNCCSNQLAHKLRSLGVGQDVLVGIAVERSIEMIVGVLAILKAGGAYVPLDPAYPEDRLSYMIENSGLSLILTQASIDHALPMTPQNRRVYLDDDYTGYSADNLLIQVHANNLAYMIFTSGTTGLPKGVGIDQKSLACHTDIYANRLALNRADCVLQYATLNFDTFGEQLFPSLCRGACVIVRGDEIWDHDTFYNNLIHYGISVANLTPSLWFHLIKDFSEKGLQDFGRLRRMIVGGEAMPPEALNLWRQLGLSEQAELWNFYGPTEATAAATSFCCNLYFESGVLLPATVPIGKPLQGRLVYIVDSDLNLLSGRVAGELVIGGGLLARGYQGRAALTAERFVPDPYSEQGGDRLYRTGDVARYRLDGNIEYLDRIDHQVKIRGFRIELGEIKSQLQSQPSVKEAVVLAQEIGGAGGQQLVAYVVPSDNCLADSDTEADAEAQIAFRIEVKSQLKAILPEYMVPNQYVILDRLPLAPNGKLNRKALPAVDGSAFTREYVAPQTELEQQLAGIWQEVLGVERVGLNDNFFELGGHSLLATQVVSRIRHSLDTDLPLRTLFEAADLRTLAQRIATASPVQVIPIEQVSRERPLPLSYAQQRQWVLWQLAPESTAYHISAALRLTGTLNQKALRQSFDAVIARHEVLRTHFAELDGELIQVVRPELSVSLTEEILERGGGEVEEDALRRTLQTHASQPFDLGCGPLLRAHLIQLSDDDYVLSLVQHHIVSDAWSMRVMVEELVATYQAYSQYQKPVLPELPIQYADYAAWQRQMMEAGEAERQLDYWRAKLGDEHLVLELPTDYPRPQQPSYRGANCTQVLPKELSDQISREAKRVGVTPFMLLLATFQLLLHRYSGQEDIRVGVPIANRTRLETERLIGFFVNTQVLRTQIAPEATVNDLLEQVKRTALEAQAHQELPFEQLVEALQPERSLNTTPLFQVMFDYHDAGKSDDQPLNLLDELVVEGVSGEWQTAQFDLTLNITDTPAVYVASFNYATGLFEPKTIERLALHWQSLLEAMVTDPNQRLSELEMLSGEERQRILQDWNATDVDYGEGICIHTLFEVQVERTPEATALVFPAQGDQPEQTLTYAELNTQANQLAHTLRHLGVGPDVLVGIAVERSVEMVIGLLGILKAGGAYVPLDPEYPEDRLSYMMEDSGIQLLLTQSDLQGSLPAPAGVQALCLDQPDTWHQSATGNLSVIINPQSLAYVIYTSGSTGKPKGVGNTHQALHNRLFWMQEAYGLSDKDRVLQKTPFSFDVSVWEFFWPLLNGARLVMAAPGDHREPERLTALIQQAGITTVHFVPSMLQAFMQYGGVGQCHSLRQIVCSGEALSAELQHQVLQTLPFAKLHNLYGPTEAAIDVTHWTCVDDGHTTVPIGRPIANIQTYIQDGALNTVPEKVVGELYLGGVGLARGYHGKPGLTAERFVPDSYDEVGGGRLYRTGDLARYQADGIIEYFGRLDHQVKIRGFRIELGEIEAQLSVQSAVNDAVVLAQDVGGTGGQQLVAYIVPADSTLTNEDVEFYGEAQNTFWIGLKAQLQATLPDYMVPSQYVLLDKLPLTTNGKLDRKALPTLDGSAFKREYVAPQTELEQQLASIWQEVLGVEHVGLNDNFFELGGHSLLATQVVSRIRQTLEVELSLRALFEAPDLRSLVQRIRDESPVQVIPMMRASRDQPLPLSYAQQRQWVLWQLAPESAAYHISVALRLTGILDIEALRQSFATVIARHEVLRTHFAEQDGELCQVIESELALPLALKTLETADGETEDQALRRMLQSHASQPFDLSLGPLLRAQLIKLGNDDHVLSLVQHHIISDAWSIRLMVEELVSAYQAYRQDRRPALHELPIQYADYAAWQRQIMEAGEAERQLAYWRKQLGDEQPVLELPTDHPRLRQPSHRGADCTQVLPKELSTYITSTAQQAGVTPFMLLLASFQLVLHRYSGQDDIRVGVPVASRTRLETERLIGFFVNTQVLRTQISPELTVNELLQQVKCTALDAQVHQDLPFEQLVETLQPERSLNTTPLFQVMFNYHDAGKSDDQPLSLLDELVVGGVSGERQTAQFDLTLNITDTPAGYVASFNYATDLFEPKTIERLALHWQSLLEAMVTDPNQRLSELEMLSGEERQRILQDWNATDVDYGEGICIHTLFEAQVERTPEATALVFPAQGDQPEQTLTYVELNTQANQLAHTLRDLGVGPDVLVGIAVERSVEMVIGLLGILKAGGAYVPLDPEYPEDRLSYMMGDSGAALLLIQSHLWDSLPIPEGVKVLCLDDLDWCELSGENLNAATQSANLAYVIYTSGSTGRPKGVSIRQGSVCNHMLWMRELLQFQENCRVLQRTAVNFDASVTEIFLTLMFGAQLIIAPPRLNNDLTQIWALVEKYQVTYLQLIPSLLQALLPHLSQYSISSLQKIVLGGEPSSIQLIQALSNASEATIYNFYGPTETTIDATHWRYEADEVNISIGHPIGNLKAYIQDVQLDVVPESVAGELYLGGIGLARGYYGKPDLTAERFVPDPYNEVGGGRLYRTGDLARYQADGTIDYLGRLDHQVKIRGFRVELGDIEVQLNAQDAVKDTVVIAQEQGAGGQQLVAYVVPTNTTLIDSQADTDRDAQGVFRAELKAQLQTALPEYMVPSQYVLVEQLPLTPNGKLDRKALPKVDGTAFTRVYEAPQTELEKQLAAIWQDVLGVEQVGLKDNFFELGGHSLLATKLLAQVHKVVIIDIPLRSLFENPVLGDFCAVLMSSSQSLTIEGMKDIERLINELEEIE